jgi:uncharacterized damage-inducible protein DinB
MAAPDIIRSQFRHIEWADAEVWKCVVASEEALKDKNLRDRLEHIHMVQQAFLHAWRAETLDYALSASFDMGALARWARDYHAQVAAYLEALDESDLERSFVLPWSEMAGKHFGRAVQVTSLGDTLVQVIAHSTYHRGQVATRLRDLGAKPPLTDFIAWAWFGKPGPEWPSGA